MSLDIPYSTMLTNNVMHEKELAPASLENLSPNSILLSLGYKTIDTIEGREWSLRFPNHEVKLSLTEELIQKLIGE